MNKKRAIVISASSDIGTAMCKRWASKGWELAGTYRTKTFETVRLQDLGVKLVHCDLISRESVLQAGLELRELCPGWDVLVLAPGTLEPVGVFEECDFDEWEESVRINFSSQLRIVHELLPCRNHGSDMGACVLFFAGGGTNGATVNYSAYTVSKIGLIKMCELLDAEVPNTRFVIVGPGWVKTKIHMETVAAGSRAGDNLKKTKDKLASDECTSMDEIIDSCDWLIQQPRHIVSGRNFSIVSDPWATKELVDLLCRDPHMFKLRRAGNNVLKNRKGIG